MPASDDATLQRARRADPRAAVGVAGRERGGRAGEARALGHRRRRRSRRRRRRCSTSAATTRRRTRTTTGCGTRASTPTRATTAPPASASTRRTCTRSRPPAATPAPSASTRAWRPATPSTRTVTLEGDGHAVHARHLHGQDHADRPVHAQRRQGHGARQARPRRHDGDRAQRRPAEPRPRPPEPLRDEHDRRRRRRRSATRSLVRDTRRGHLHHARSTTARRSTTTLAGGAGGDRPHRRDVAHRRRGLAAAEPLRHARFGRHADQQGPGLARHHRPEGVAGHPAARQRVRASAPTPRPSTCPAGWDASYGATLSLGQVTDTFTLTVNGQAVGVDGIDPTVDLGPYLHAGANTIAVRVATTYQQPPVRAGHRGPQPRRDPELRPRRPGRPDAVPAGGGVQLDQRGRDRRRNRARDALADARRAGDASGRSRRAWTAPTTRPRPRP